jgi:hypothetical protein
LMNLMIFILCLHFVQLKTHCNRMWMFMFREQNVQNFI